MTTKITPEAKREIQKIRSIAKERGIEVYAIGGAGTGMGFTVTALPKKA